MPTNNHIEQLFDDIAPNYDRLNHIMSLNIDKSWRRKAVRRIADEKRPLQVLDLATGTGDFAIAIARKLSPGSSVIGIDLSEKMLAIGSTKVLEAELSDRVTLQQGNAEALSFADGTFDRVSVAFGVRNYEDRQGGLREACRVLKPGGRLIILELSSPDNRLLLALYKWYALKVLPHIGGRISGSRSAYTYLPESVLQFPKPAEFLPMLHNAGFSKCSVKNLTFGICRMYTAEKQQ